MDKSKLYGRVIFTMNIQAKTGLHIGGSSTGLEIGGVDNPVIRDLLTGVPYIPGSSLRGKMRSQLEKALGLRQNNSIGSQVKIHTCKTTADYEANGGCPVCHIFGVPGETDIQGSTRLVVRDVPMTPESVNKLIKAHTDLAFTELKTEVAIDRVTSAATPRNLERVPAGTVFGPAELVFSIYEMADVDRLTRILEGLQLVQDDYLGGAGSRGSGKVEFTDIHVSARNGKHYSMEEKYQKPLNSLADLEANFPDIKQWVRQVIPQE